MLQADHGARIWMAEEEGALGEEEERPGAREVPGLEPRSLAERRGPRLSGLQLPHPNREDAQVEVHGAVRVKYDAQAEEGQGTSGCSPFSSRAPRPTPGGPTRGGQGGPPCPGGRPQLRGPERVWEAGLRIGAGKRQEPGLQLGALGLLHTEGCQFSAWKLFLVGLHDRRSGKVLTGRDTACSLLTPGTYNVYNFKRNN